MQFHTLCASNHGEIRALGTEELGCSCSSGWPGGPSGFVVLVIQQSSLGGLCKGGKEGGSVGVVDRNEWVILGRLPGSKYDS